MNTKQIATKQYGNRVLASVVALLMLLGLVPLSVLAEGYTKQGDALKVHMVDPGASYITTSRLENGDYLNEISVGYDSSVPVVFTIDIGDGDGTNHLDPTEFQNYIKVFKSSSLTPDSLVYTYGVDSQLTIEDIGGQTTLQRGRKYKFSISSLEKGTDYYLAFMAGMSSAQRGAELGSQNVIFKFSTLEDATKVNSVSLESEGVILEGIGQTVELKATVLPASASDKSIKWSSSDATVASVDAAGTVTARKAGKATITVTTVDGGKTASCPVTVKDAASSDVLTKVSGTQILKSEAKFTIDEPAVYRSAKTGSYVIPDEVELSALPKIHITMIPNGGRKGTVFNPHVFADDTLKEEVAKSGDGISADIPDYTYATFTLDPAKLEAGKTYYFTLDSRSTCGGVALGEDVIIEFTVKGEEPVTPTEDWQPYRNQQSTTDNVTFAWVEPAPADLQTLGLVEEDGVQFYKNRSKKNVDVSKDWRLQFTLSGSGSQHVGTEAWNHVAIYDDSSLTQDHLIASVAKGNLKDLSVVVEGMPTLSATLPANTLQPNKFYYLVTDEDLETNRGRKMSVKTVTEFYTETSSTDPTPSEPDDPTPSEPDDPTPSEPDDPTPSEPDDPTPSEPDDPTPVEPVTKFTGLANEADKDGNWWYYTDGEIDKTHTSVDQNKYGWWRVENGKVNFKAQSIYQNQFGWWKTTDGKVTFKENSIYQNQYGWWKCKDSKVDFTAQNIYQNQFGWWKTTDGKVTFKENGIFSNQYGTWKVENSKVNFDANGIYSFQGKTYSVTNGKATLKI